jgi:hypothetical protein
MLKYRFFKLLAMAAIATQKSTKTRELLICHMSAG